MSLGESNSVTNNLEVNLELTNGLIGDKLCIEIVVQNMDNNYRRKSNDYELWKDTEKDPRRL